jgi:hypothetical protein
MGNLHQLDVPEPREFLDLLLVCPVTDARQIPVGTALAGVLGARLPVHLHHRRPRAADHPPHQVDVVDLHSRRAVAWWDW